MTRAFLNILENDHLAQVFIGIEHAVAKSFDDDHSQMTGAEVRRRFDICARLVGQLRGDLGWGLQRVLDHLPGYLRCELDGQPWEPDRRTCWMPEDGA
jgi:hypothetical protein